MNDILDIIARPAIKHRIVYVCKAAVAFAVLFVIGSAAEMLPSFAIALIWALLTCAMTIAFAYPYVIKRMATAAMYREGSIIHNRINGRALLLIACFVLSAVLATSLILDIQRWTGREWLVAIIAIPLFMVVNALASKGSASQYEEAFQRRGAMLWGLWVTGAFLTVAYALILAFGPSHEYASLGETFSSTRQLFADSPSALMAEIGKWEYVVQCLTAFGFDQAEKAPFVIYLAISLVLCFCTSFAIAHLLSLCSLDRTHLERVFLPLGATKYAPAHLSMVRASLATLGVMSMLSIALFMAANAETNRFTQTDWYASVEEAVRTQTGLSAYEVNGKNHATQTVDDVMEQALLSNPEAKLARDDLVRAVNESYDACADKVDGYLDWYFNPLTGIERIINFFGNSASEHLHQEYQERIGSELDNADLTTCIDIYDSTRDSLKEQVESGLSESALYGIPDWIVAHKKSLDEFPQFQRLSHTPELLDPEGEFTGLTTKRDKYRDAILEAIEKSRSEMLAQIE